MPREPKSTAADDIKRDEPRNMAE